MKSLLALLWQATSCVILTVAFLTPAQGQIEVTPPYNPDWDENDFVGATDLIQLLSIFGFDFEADSTLIDGVALEDVLAEMLASLDSLQSATASPCPDPCNGMTTVDWQGETYGLVPIGCDCWFAENLRAVQYANGDSIPIALVQW